MVSHRGGYALTDFTEAELREIILRALKQAARDVDERRVPLDGRVRLPPTDETDQLPTIGSAAAE